MTDRLTRILDHLAPLVAADTRNPPRKIDGDHALVRAVREALPDGFDLDVSDLGGGSVILDARRGEPDVLFNVHMDTVPAADGWSREPHTLHRAEDRAYGLGTCDTKGAAAVLLTLAEDTDAPMRLVLTTDEEAGQATCVRTFLETLADVRLAVIAEPTDARAVTRHRGVCSATARFAGRSGHASQGGVSAVHQAARWIADCMADDLAAETRLNFGRIEGGVKPNMVAAACEVMFGFRTPPGEDHDDILRAVRGRAPEAEHATRFVGPGLPVGTDAARDAQDRAEAEARRLNLVTGDPVDFWTEASLFAAAEVPAVVLGAGNIAQAHAVDEWVSYDSLSRLYDAYERIVTDG